MLTTLHRAKGSCGASTTGGIGTCCRRTRSSRFYEPKTAPSQHFFDNTTRESQNRFCLAILLPFPSAFYSQSYSYVVVSRIDVSFQHLHLVFLVLNVFASLLSPVRGQTSLRPTDELLIALHHDSPPGRACICSWDPCTSGSIP